MGWIVPALTVFLIALFAVAGPGGGVLIGGLTCLVVVVLQDYRLKQAREAIADLQSALDQQPPLQQPGRVQPVAIGAQGADAPRLHAAPQRGPMLSSERTRD